MSATSNSADDLEALAAEAGIVGEREAEVAGAHHRDPQFSVKAQNLPEMALEILDVVADAADAELAEIGQILANLGGVEVKLLRQRLRRDGLHARVFELSQAAQIDRQTIGRELGNLLTGWRDACSMNSQASSEYLKRTAVAIRRRVRLERRCRTDFASEPSRFSAWRPWLHAITWGLWLPLRRLLRYPDRISVLPNLQTDAAAYHAIATGARDDSEPGRPSAAAPARLGDASRRSSTS